MHYVACWEEMKSLGGVLCRHDSFEFGCLEQPCRVHRRVGVRHRVTNHAGTGPQFQVVVYLFKCAPSIITKGTAGSGIHFSGRFAHYLRITLESNTTGSWHHPSFVFL